MGSNPSSVYWMNIISHIFVVKIKSLFEKTKINEKEAGDGPLKQILFDFGSSIVNLPRNSP